MRVERALLEELSEKVFNIGYQGELNHTQVIISCPVMFRDYPDAVASMVVKPPQGDLYPVSLTRDGNDLTWDVSASDVAIPGAGILQLTFTDGEGDEAEIIKTVYGAYSVNASLVANGEAPDPVQSWLDEAGAALATFENEIGDIRKITTATEEDEGLALSPKTVVNGKVTEWEYIDLADPEVVTQAIDDWLDDHPEATTTVEDGAITEAKLNDSLKADLAWQDDVDELKSAIKRPEFIVGNAEEVLSDRGETDEAVYLFRKSGGTKKAYNREQVKKIIGGTVAWNQLMTGMTTATNDGITTKYYSDTNEIGIKNDSRTTNYGTGSTRGPLTANFIVGHKYILIPSKSITGVVFVRGNSANELQNIFEMQEDYEPRMRVTSAYDFVSVHPVGDETKFKLSIIDLTAALGSTIADYLYTLETQTAGSGVALFRSLFDKSYYAYNAGSLESVNVSEHRCVGFNLFDKSTATLGKHLTNTGDLDNDISGGVSDYIRVLPSVKYYLLNVMGSSAWYTSAVYDSEKNFIKTLNIGGGVQTSGELTMPSNAGYIRIDFKASAIDSVGINIYDSSRNGQYEPYQLSTYSMPNVTLRGIPKLVNNEIVFDGDELTPDGTVKRKYGIVDMGTLTWVNATNSRFSAYVEGAPISGTRITKAICSKYEALTNGEAYDENWDKVCYFSAADIYVSDSSYSDPATFKTAMSGVYLVYELATPTTETADPYQELQVCSRYGTEEYIDRLATAETSPRDVSIPCGHETFYPVNVFDYIDELTKPDADFIADANIASGKYFSVGNGLYLSTQAIAQGETIIPGTNCTAVSLADALNAINQ